MRVKRSRNLGAQEIQTIVGILDGWTGPLTWNLLIDAVASRLLSSIARHRTIHFARRRLINE
jgi:hypothetical protein